MVSTFRYVDRLLSTRALDEGKPSLVISDLPLCCQSSPLPPTPLITIMISKLIHILHKYVPCLSFSTVIIVSPYHLVSTNDSKFANIAMVMTAMADSSQRAEDLEARSLVQHESITDL